jgi:hypothetical protein
VVLAARCAGWTPPPPEPGRYLSRGIVFPADLMEGRTFDEMFPPRRYPTPDGEVRYQPQAWELRGPFDVDLKGIPNQKLLVAATGMIYMPSISTEERARLGLKWLEENGQYRP